MSATPTPIGAAIKNRRKRMGLSQNELSFKAGVTKMTISKLERGRQGVTIGGKTSILEDIAAALNCRASTLLLEAEGAEVARSPPRSTRGASLDAIRGKAAK